MKKILLSTFGLMFVLGLFGCGDSSVQLDRTVTIKGLTVDVPSVWIEDSKDYSGGGGDYSFTNGYTSFTDSDENDDAHNELSVSYSDVSLDETPEEAANDYVEMISEPPLDTTLIEEFVIDGARCEVYDFFLSIEGQDNLPYIRVAYIFTSDMHYELQGTGDYSVLDAALKTVKLS